jgi:hypothetical protein
MAAEENNKYAEKVTREAALQLARQAVDVINDDCYLLSEVAQKCGTYRTKFNYLLQKFSDDEEVKDNIEKMYNKCEAILARKAITKEIQPIVSIFILKSYHSLTETTISKQEIEITDLQGLYKKAMQSNEQHKAAE